jgi:hypothetical protein
MACLVALTIGQGSQEVGILRNTLGLHQKLIHRHTGVKGYNHAREVLDISFFNGIGALAANQVHKFVDTHEAGINY